ncbi:MAG TPA: TM0106 family RecB-like putative nuclease [Miltoncostaeaceae bacterium]|nr:TM0106 family RecB-like putative nuclease [Miltoncostaeaceae bacterium]
MATKPSTPTRLTTFLACRRAAELDEQRAAGLREPPPWREDERARILREHGMRHEEAYVDSLGQAVVRIPFGGAPGDAEAATHAAMRQGAPLIYQAAFEALGWRARADVLVSVPRPTELGLWGYEAVDAKLAREPHPGYLLQLLVYSELIAHVQGEPPEDMHVHLGDGRTETFRTGEFDAYYRRLRRRFDAARASGHETEPYPCDHCAICDWAGLCNAWWDEVDHLCRVAEIRRGHVRLLAPAGVETLQALGEHDPARGVAGISTAMLQRLHDQARLQLGARRTGVHTYELLPPEPDRGFARMPLPAEGDLFLDIEGDELWGVPRGLEFLFGIAWAEGGEERYQAFWAHDREQERAAFEAVMDLIAERRAADPGLHVYHYAPYEPSTFKRLMGEYGTREDAMDDLLRQEVFVDLYGVVRQSMRISHPGYSLKDVEQFFFVRENPLGGMGATLGYEGWRETRDQATLDAIEAYNRDDCIATLRLRDWLLERRAEAVDEHGEIAWHEVPPREPPTPEEHEAALERARLREELEARTDEHVRLLGALLDHHRREAKPSWWAYFARRLMTPEELERDAESIGGLIADGEPAPEKQSFLYPMRFPPQELRLGARDQPHDPATGKGAGTIVEIDPELGTLVLKRGKKRSGDPLPAALMPSGPYDTRCQRDALTRLGRIVRDGEGDARAPHLMRLLARRPPLDGAPVQREGVDAIRALVPRIDPGYLVVQGPPGSGKTYTGARLVTQLIRDGKRVGVAAPSHRAIHNLLEEIEAVAADEGLAFVGRKKGSEDNPESQFEGERITTTFANPDMLDPELDLLAGTAWLFAREDMQEHVDVLVIDEAGQVSLADALAMGMSSRRLILLGDPAQLPQVTQGVHPPGAGVSVLEHVLGGEETIPEDMGVFLTHTRRMHPDVCGFISRAFYAGRLSPVGDALTRHSAAGTGLRFQEIDHVGDTTSSAEEAAWITGEYERLRGLGVPADQMLIVAPFNAQVARLRRTLPDGARVGTVDKFQGQEADVVFFSMTSSSAEDVPRGLDFLLSRNRLNVAVSRAKCAAYVVASPGLLEIDARTIDQMRLADALCRFAEEAEAQLPGEGAG